MNALENYILTNELDEGIVMNALQEDGVVSDECVAARDVADRDCTKAIKFLIENGLGE
ncbi:MAG: hypothetical protein AAB883_01820 [Patescibacteria group bacterium]